MWVGLSYAGSCTGSTVVHRDIHRDIKPGNVCIVTTMARHRPPPSPNAEPELLTWHEVIGQRPHVALDRFYWDQKTARLWYAALTVDGIAVELLMRTKTSTGWPGFIIAADLGAYLDERQGLRAEIKTPSGRPKSLNYKPTVTVKPTTPPRWLALTTGTVGSALFDEIEHIIRVVRAGEVKYVKHADIHAVKADATLQSTVEQWGKAWAIIASRIGE